MNLNAVSGRVRVAVRLRPRNVEEKVADADFEDCVQLQPEVALRKSFYSAFKFMVVYFSC